MVPSSKGPKINGEWQSGNGSLSSRHGPSIPPAGLQFRPVQVARTPRLRENRSMHAAAVVSIALTVFAVLGASPCYADDFVRALSTWSACLYRETDSLAASESPAAEIAAAALDICEDEEHALRRAQEADQTRIFVKTPAETKEAFREHLVERVAHIRMHGRPPEH